MVQKAPPWGNRAGMVSAPTALAVRMADFRRHHACAIGRADGFEVFTHPYRILFGAIADAAGQLGV